MRIDLHFHSDASDGTRSPETLKDIIVSRNVKIVSLTDHDSIKNTEKLKNLLQGTDTFLIPGIELSTQFHKHNIHILGYFRDESYKSPEFTEVLESFRIRRIQRAEEMVLRLKKYFGLEIDLEKLDLRPGVSLGRPHMAQLIKEKYGFPINEIFKKYLGNNSPAYIPSSNMTTEEGIDFLISSGAVPVLAHPGEYTESISDLLTLNFMGIECYYPRHSEKLTRELTGEAVKRNLFITCGTDDHGIPGDHKHGILGSQKYDPKLVAPFLEYMGAGYLLEEE